MKCVFDHRCAQHYDEWYQRPGGAQALRLERGLIKRYLEPRPGERLLDIGSGTGIHLAWFKELGLQVTGLMQVRTCWSRHGVDCEEVRIFI